MPQCRNCRRPIIFLSEMREWINVSTNYTKPEYVWTSPRPVPLDIDPHPAGTVALYEWPSPHSVYPPDRDAKVRTTYIRRMSGALLDMHRASGAAMYRVHFDSCPARQTPSR